MKRDIETKLGRNMSRLLEVDFVTQPKHCEEIVNVLMYNENRFEGITKGWWVEDYLNFVHTPGCISCVISNLFSPIKQDHLNIHIVFGSNAASSRKPLGTKEQYPNNSHKQLPEVEYMFGLPVNISHELDTTMEDSIFIVNGVEKIVDTIHETNMYALSVALQCPYFDEN